MKKPLIIFLSIFSLATIALISTSHANMFNKFKKGFYFEKYSNAEEAKAELIRLHPIGSDVGELVKTLEKAGGKKIKVATKMEVVNNNKERLFYKLVPLGDNSYKEIKLDDAAISVTVLEYKVGVINPFIWKVFIWADKNNLVVDFNVVKYYMGL